MCIRKAGRSKEEIEASKSARREKRSAFLSRMMDEFKKIGFVATFVFCVIVIAVCISLFAISLVSPEAEMIPAEALALQNISIAAFGIIATAFGFYCKSTTAEKTSLNDNKMVKNKDGTFSKIAEAVSTVLNGATTKAPDDDEAKG